MKRASSILLSLVLVLGLAACGDTGGDEGSDSGPTTTEAGAGEETTGTTDEGDPAVAALNACAQQLTDAQAQG